MASKKTYLKSTKLNSDEESDDEGLSELMSNFNATSYSKNSSKSEDARNTKAAKRNDNASYNNNNDKLMMTMKPWQHNASPPARGGVKSRLGEQGSTDEDSFSDDDLRHTINKQASRQVKQSKSPSSPSHESTVVPKPVPRQRLNHGQSPPATGLRHSPYDSIDALPGKDSSRKTPVHHSKSPVISVEKEHDRHAAAAVNEAAHDPHSRHVKHGHSPSSSKSPEGPLKGDAQSSRLPQYRGTPVDGYRMSPLDQDSGAVEAFSDYHSVRKYSTGSANRGEVDQYQDELFGRRKSPADRYNSPFENKSRDSPADSTVSAANRKYSGLAELSPKPKQQPKASMNRELEPAMKHKDSGADFSMETSERFDAGFDSPLLGRSMSSKGKNSFEQERKVAKEEGFDSKVAASKKKLEKSKSDQQSIKRENTEEVLNSDGESSVCNDLVEEPVKPKKTDKEGTQTALDKQVKSRTSERQKAYTAIDLVKDAQNKMKFIDPADVKPPHIKRPSSAASAMVAAAPPPVSVLKPQPRYVKPSVATSSAKEPRPESFESTEAIREAVFREWRDKRLPHVKQDIIEKQRKEKEAEEKMLKEKHDKEDDARKAYLAWLSDKKGHVSDHTKKKRMEEKKALKEEEEQKRKKKDAEATFAQWKAQIDAQLKEKQKRSLKETKKSEEQKKEDEEDKKKQARSAYLAWKEKKDAVIMKSIEEQTKAQREKEKKKRQEAQLEAEEARRAYERWLEEKERNENLVSQMEMEKRPSWRPASNTIPFGRSH